jgi:hypothetical protein
MEDTGAATGGLFSLDHRDVTPETGEIAGGR